MPEQKPADLPTINISGVEIFAEGRWNGDAYSVADLDQMIAAFGKVGFEPPIKAGHEPGQEKDADTRRKLFGSPALGYVSKLYVSGKKLMADLVGVPAMFGRLIKAGAYKRISAEIYWNYSDESSGKKWPRVLKAVSFLGADIPAITDLRSVEALYTRSSGGALTYKDGKNEVRVYDKNYCGCDGAMGSMPSLSLSDFLMRYPRKTKDEVGYDSMSAIDAPTESCGQCKFFIASGFLACSLVEGRIEPNDICDLFEPYATALDVTANPVYERGGNFSQLINPEVDASDKTNKKGEQAMADESKNTANAELQASFTKQMESFKLEMNENIGSVKKEYEAKLSEKDAVIENLTKAREADEKRIATIEFAKKQDEVRYFLKEQNTAGRLAPVEQSRAEALMLSLSDTRQVKFSQEGKEIETSELEAFKEFITKRPSLFTETSEHTDERAVATTGEANTQMFGTDESTKLAREYMDANKGVSMRDAYKHVWEKNPKLFAEWQSANGQAN